MTLILGIESSCDETAAAVVAHGRAVRSSIIATQHELHEKYAGVVPEIASRAHLERITPVIEQALRAADCTLDDITAIAVGNRPGLVGSLLVGVSAAKALAWATNKPLIGIDHVRAHLYAALLTDDKTTNPPATVDQVYPALGLVVSGGHTNLYEVTSPLTSTLLGRTIDDAVGEAFDKAAVILGLGFPGGPAIDKAAQRGDAAAHRLPRSLLEADSLDFSYSGLKTALLYAVQGKPVGRGGDARFERSYEDLTDQQRDDMAASFQAAAIEPIIVKLQRAIEQLRSLGRAPRSLIIGGGVCANSLLRTRVLTLGASHDVHVLLPRMVYCLDNAAMIAGLAHHHYTDHHFDDLDLPAIATTAM